MKSIQQLDNIEDKVGDNSRTIGVITKSFWLVTSAVALAFASHIFM